MKFTEDVKGNLFVYLVLLLNMVILKYLSRCGSCRTSNAVFLKFYLRTSFSFYLCFTVIHQARETVSSGYPNTEKRVEDTARGGVNLTKFEVFEKPTKHRPECLAYLLNRNKN